MNGRRRPLSLADIAKDRAISQGVQFGGSELGRQLHPDIAVKAELPDGNVEMTDGSILNSSGEVIKEGSLASQMREYGGYAAAAYQLYKAMKAGDTKGQVLGTAGAINTGLQAGGVIGVGPGAIIGGALSATGALMSDASAEQKATAVRRGAEDTAANIATGGLWGLGQIADQALLGGKLTKARGKYEDFLSSPVGTALMPGMGLTHRLQNKVLEKGISMFGSGKGKDQLRRDAIRKMMQEKGMFGGTEDDWTLENADGSSFDVGKDGGARLDDGRRYFDVDVNKQGEAIGSVNPLAYLMTGGDKQLATEMAGYLTNTITQGKGGSDAATANLNALDKYKKAGFDTFEKANSGIDQMLQAGRIDQATADAFKGGLRTVYGQQSPVTAKPTQSQPQQTTQTKPKPAAKKPIQNKAPAPVSLADLAPVFSKPPVMPEPDDEPTPEEIMSVTDYRNKLEQLFKNPMLYGAQK